MWFYRMFDTTRDYYGLTDNAILKKNINKDEVIKLDDVELNLLKEVIEARDYQYNLI